ncbi:MAG: LPS export ABC transporter periplasmic protein LptC [Bacteroidales bacterium]|nr:LPS export ABC transporter periplasmic protein LptC [Bacteroidales bacterium]
MAKINGNIKSVATVFVMVAMLFCVVSCKKKVHEYTDSVENRALTPTLRATDVMTTVSDSGITRYRLTTPLWEIYEHAEEPYWAFSQGLHFDRFDPNFNVDAQIDCDRATYWSVKKLWHLEGNVKCTNLEGERFETPELYWDQNLERIYSDSVIVIYKQDLKITGKGFESNQTLTNYRILLPQGIIPINTDEEEETTEE